jgi:hypothetical protein
MDWIYCMYVILIIIIMIDDNDASNDNKIMVVNEYKCKMWSNNKGE